MEWTDLKISAPRQYADTVEAIATGISGGGIYIEDYADLEAQVQAIAHVDLIEQELLEKDRETVIVHMYLSPDENPAEVVELLNSRLTAAAVPYTLALDGVEQEDWENAWRKYYHAMEIGSRLAICPSWEEYEGDRTVIRLDPGMAFGTGTHETTRLCLELLEKYMVPGCDFLDMGCGSGILSVAALLLGAKSAVGVDIDPLAVKTAVENANTNHVGEKFTGICGNLAEKVTGKFQVVAANIVADIVILLSKDAPRFLEKDSVYLISGIIDTREQDVLDAIGDTFQVLERREEKGWIAMALKLK